MKLYFGGTIWTVASSAGADWTKHPAEALLTGDDGRILFAGSESEAREVARVEQRSNNDSVQLTEINLQGQTVLPGFVDTHVHAPGSVFTEMFEIYLYSARGKKEVLAKIADFIKKNPKREAYFGTGFYMSIFADSSEIPRLLLDEICAEKPFVLQSSDGHTLWLNTKALEVCGIDKNTPIPLGGKIEFDAVLGEPTGILSDAFELVPLRASYSLEQTVEAMRCYQKKMLAWGHTAALHIAPPFGDPAAIRKLANAGEWKMRTNLCALAEKDRPLSETFAEIAALEKLFEGAGAANGDPENFKVTTVKYFADGVVEGMTAYLKEPYEEAAGGEKNRRGEPLWNTNELAKSFREVSEKGYQIHVHSIGDAATEQVLFALEKARAGSSAPLGNRDTLTHLQLVDAPEQEKMAELGIIAAEQPFWHFKEPRWYEEIEENFLGEARASAAYPVASLLEKGVKITFSGDYPASPNNNPFFAIEAAVTRNLASGAAFGIDDIKDMDEPTWLRNASERISLKDAIEAYTINGAFQLFREKDIGSLEVGKFADFIVLDKDPFAIDPIDIDKIKVVETIIGGESVI